MPEIKPESKEPRSDSPLRSPNREPNKDTSQMARRARAVMGIATVGLLLLAFVRLVNPSRGAQQMRYDEFKSRVRAGDVEEVFVASDSIRGRLRRAPSSGAPGSPPRLATRNAPPGDSLDFETTRIGDDKDLIPLLESAHVRYSGVPERSGLWMFLLSVVAPIVLVIFISRTMMRRAQNPQGGILAFGKSKGRIVGENDVHVRFDDVAGVEEAKDELKEIVEFLRQPEKFTRLGARIPKGVLLVGPPGTGKTLLARAVAGEANVPFFSISGSEFVEMFVGVGAARVRDMFEQAAQQAPCIVFIDELDALGRSRGANIMGTNEEREQTLNQLLVQMDGFEVNKGVIIMAATNRPEILDAALLRPGRFDRQVLVDRPDRRGREAILRVHAKSVKLDVDVDLAEIAARTPGFSGADLANVINEAALLGARKDQQTVKRADITEAIDRVVAGLERKSRIITLDERVRVAHHEAGHAIVGEVIAGAEKVAKISIVPRGLAALGYTMHLPTEDRYIMTEGELKARLAAMLGGRAAERLIFNDLSTGASDDLSRAADLARAMVTDYGMSEKLGPLSLKRNRRAAFIPSEMGMGELREHGERMTNLVDDEVKRIIEEAESRAVAVLTERRPALAHIAKVLIEKEYLDGDELRRLLADARAPSVIPPLAAPNSETAIA